MAERRTEMMALSSIKPATRNAKRHSADGIARSIERFGVIDAPVVDERTGRLVGGHGRVEDLVSRLAAGQSPPEGVEVDPTSGEWLVPVQRGWASMDDREADAAAIALNRLTEAGGWDDRMLAEMLGELAEADEALLSTVGYSDDDLKALLASLPSGMPQPGPEPDRATLATRFVIPPFSVLDARQGYWQDRKKAWLSLGIQSELGRGGVSDLVGRGGDG